MRLFYQNNKKSKKIEERVEKGVEEFLKKIKKKRLSNYIEVFGLTGPAARGQATIYGSDIDFYVITKSLNLKKEKKLRTIFNNVFKEREIEVSLLTASPTIYKKPDLMFYEFIHSEGFLWGRPRISKDELTIKMIPKWEGVRLLTFRIDPFLNTIKIRQKGIEIKTNKPDYYYSKVIQGVGEAFLLLEDKYKADNFERLKLIRKSKYAKQLGIIKEFEKLFNYYVDKLKNPITGYVDLGEIKKIMLKFEGISEDLFDKYVKEILKRRRNKYILLHGGSYRIKIGDIYVGMIKCVNR